MKETLLENTLTQNDTSDLIWKHARKQAQTVLANYWDQITFPIPVITISNMLGVQTFTAPLPNNLSGMIIKDDPYKDARIYIDSSKSPERQRCLFAHELGHYIERIVIAHSNEFSFEDKSHQNDYDLHEFYANEFAGALLIPEDDLKEMLDNNVSLPELAAHYGTSLSALNMRIENLRKNE